MGIREIVTVPFEIPTEWSIAKNQKIKLPISNDRLSLWYSQAQIERHKTNGSSIASQLTGKTVLGIADLKYLLANPLKIPNNWRGEAVFFWGTIYSTPTGEAVLYLRSDGECWWYSAYCLLSDDWAWYYPAAIIHR